MAFFGSSGVKKKKSVNLQTKITQMWILIFNNYKLFLQKKRLELLDFILN